MRRAAVRFPARPIPFTKIPIQDAQFIVDSLPNVEIFSVEWALRQLHAIHLVLVNFDDKWLIQEEIEQLIQSVLDLWSFGH